MIDELTPIWEQRREINARLRDLIETVPDERLDWELYPDAETAIDLIQHIAAGNRVYSLVSGNPVQLIEHPTRAELRQILDNSEVYLYRVLECITEEDMTAMRADDWRPLGVGTGNPLDGYWITLETLQYGFAAEHVEQISYLFQLPQSVLDS